MDVLLRESENLRNTAVSTSVASSMFAPSSRASSTTYPWQREECVLPSSRQQGLLSDVSSRSSIFQKGPLHSGVSLLSQKEYEISAEHDILRSQNSRITSTALTFIVETTKQSECNGDSVPEQCILGEGFLPPPGFEIESLSSLVTPAVALPSTSVVPLLNSAVATQGFVTSPQSSVVPSFFAQPHLSVASAQFSVAPSQSPFATSQSPVASLQFSVASPQFSVAPFQSPVASPQFSVASPQFSVAPFQSPVATSQSLVAPVLLSRPIIPKEGNLSTRANQEAGTGSSLLTTANQEQRTNSSLLTMSNQEMGPRSTKTNQKPAKSELYKTELCRAFSEKGICGYGEKCQFAHGESDQRAVNRHVKYKTKQCWTYHSTGFCYYGARCNFIHDDNRLDRGVRMTSCQGDNISPRFASKLDTAAGGSSETNLNRMSGIDLVNPCLAVKSNTGSPVHWDPRMKVNAASNLQVNPDVVSPGLNPRVEPARNTEVGRSLDSGIALAFKLGISTNSHVKAEKNVNLNAWLVSNGMVPISNGTVPISNGMVPISNGMVPISNGMVPISNGMVPISNGTVSSSNGIVPISNGTVPLSNGLVPISGQNPRHGMRLINLEWNQRSGHSSAGTDVLPAAPSLGVARDKDVVLRNSRSKFSGFTLEDRCFPGQSHQPVISPPQLPQTRITGAVGLLFPDAQPWNKEEPLMELSLNHSCTEGSCSSHASMESTSAIWSSLIKHPRGWTLS